MSEILDEIVENKRREVDRQKEQTSRELLRERARAAQPLGFREALMEPGIQLIAEIKPKAPSAGDLTDLDPVEIAGVYERSLPAAVSVLTDREYFGMDLGDFGRVREHLSKPVLRKEFIVDSYQILQSAVLGADCVLLIASVLSSDQLQEFHEQAHQFGMDALVEVHSREEWENLGFEPPLLGINNRDLSGDFSTDLTVTEELAGDLPEDVCVVSESGIGKPEDLQRLSRVENVQAVLVGTSLVQDATTPEQIEDRIRDLMDYEGGQTRG